MGLASTTGLAANDIVRFASGQTVRLTATPTQGLNQVITFTPATTSAMANGVAVTWQAPRMGAGSGYTTGNTVWVTAKSTIIDPAGNTSNNVNVRSGFAQ